MNRNRLYWTCQLGGWAGYTVVGIVLPALFRPLTWEAVTGNVLLGAFGVLYTPLYRSATHRGAWRRQPLGQLAPRVLAASVVIATILHITVDPIGRYVLQLGVYQAVESEVGLRVGSIANGSILILLWSLLYYGVHAIWDHCQAEVDRWKMKAQMESTKLKALKLQLNPHFFFNSLNSVRALIAEDPARAQRMVTQLAGLLRTTLRSDDRSMVALREEIRTVRSYLELEAVRLEERLQYRSDVDETLWNASVPFLLVQTLVENAIKHGIAPRATGGTVEVSARRVNDTLRLCVDNPGKLNLNALAQGVGLRNARERLHLLFGDDALLTLDALDTMAVRAEVQLPLNRPRRTVALLPTAPVAPA